MLSNEESESTDDFLMVTPILDSPATDVLDLVVFLAAALILSSLATADIGAGRLTAATIVSDGTSGAYRVVAFGRRPLDVCVRKVGGLFAVWVLSSGLLKWGQDI